MPHAILPSLTLNAGVTGHCSIPEDLETAISDQVRRTLGLIRETSTLIAERLRDKTGMFESEPTLRLISCLAEGSDRLAARSALDSGFSLQAVLPFPRTKSRTPISGNLPAPGSRDELEALCSQAESVLELDRSVPDYWNQLPDEVASLHSSSDIAESFRQDAYEEANQEMLSRSDILLALWNGKPQAAKASTFACIRAALASGIPVIIFSLSQACPPRLAVTEDDLFARQAVPADKEHLSRCLERILSPSGNSLDQLRAFLDRTAAAARIRLPVAAGWWQKFQKAMTRKVKAAPCPYREPGDPAFALFDRAANAYASIQRSAFLWVSALSVLAVSLSALTVAIPAGDSRALYVAVLKLLQAACLLGVIRLFFITSRENWKEKLTTVRYLAETLRLYEFNRLLGMGRFWLDKPPQPNISAEREHYLEWMLRQHCRSLPGISIDYSSPEQFARIKKDLTDYLISNQLGYHKLNSARCQLMNSTISSLATRIFYLSFAIVVSNIVIAIFGAPPLLTVTLGLVATIAPVIAGSAKSIAVRAELKRLSIASARTAGNLEDLAGAVQGCRDGRMLRRQGLRAFRMLLADTEEWKALYRLSNITL
jgi:hypothetical protein